MMVVVVEEAGGETTTPSLPHESSRQDKRVTRESFDEVSFPALSRRSRETRDTRTDKKNNKLFLHFVQGLESVGRLFDLLPTEVSDAIRETDVKRDRIHFYFKRPLYSETLDRTIDSVTYAV